jgi:hypothetical protein
MPPLAGLLFLGPLPMAVAMGYMTSPASRADFFNELATQDIRFQFPFSSLHLRVSGSCFSVSDFWFVFFSNLFTFSPCGNINSALAKIASPCVRPFYVLSKLRKTVGRQRGILH